jgi:hypothetical protein
MNINTDVNINNTNNNINNIDNNIKNIDNNKNNNINNTNNNINNTVVNINKYDNFWIELIEYFGYCYERIKHMSNNITTQEKIKIIILKKINSYLNDLPLDISYTYGEINNIYLENYNNIIEIYISPMLNKDNIKYMNELYKYYFKYKTQLPGLVVSKYRIFNKKNKKIVSIDFTANILSSASSNNINNYSILYDDANEEINENMNNMVLNNHLVNKQKYNSKYIFSVNDISYTSVIGKNENDNLILHLVIIFSDNVNYFFDKKTIKFENTENDTQRDVWICNNNVINIILENYIGEENLINYIGYIEFLNINEADKNIHYNSIDNLIYDIDLVRNNNNIIYCNLCNHSSNQVNLSRCGKCKKVYYCNKICQKIDHVNHKIICK